MQDVDRSIRELAARQHGLVTARQTTALGLSADQLDHRTCGGQLTRWSNRVIGVTGAAETSIQALMAMVLDTGRHAALSHTSALAHWGVRGFTTDPVHVTRRRDVDDHPVPGVTVHEVRFLPVSEVRVLEGIPVVSPSLALLQLAGTRCTAHRLGRAIDAAWSDRLVTYRTLRAVDRLMSRRGRAGLQIFRAHVEERGPSYVPPASNVESRFAEILERNDRRPMRRQVDSSGEKGWIGRVDFRDDRLPVIAEVQSERFHIGLTAVQDDRVRIAALRAAGFEVVEITDQDIFHRVDRVLALVDEARARAADRPHHGNWPGMIGP